MAYRVEILDNRDMGVPGWRIADERLAWALGLESNDDAAAWVRAAMAADPRFAGRAIALHGQVSCFLGCALERADLELLADLIAGLVAAGPHPRMRPGTGRVGPGSAALAPPTRPALAAGATRRPALR